MMMSGSFSWVCICIRDGGHFSFPYAYVDPGTIGLALKGIVYTRGVDMFN